MAIECFRFFSYCRQIVMKTKIADAYRNIDTRIQWLVMLSNCGGAITSGRCCQFHRCALILKRGAPSPLSRGESMRLKCHATPGRGRGLRFHRPSSAITGVNAGPRPATPNRRGSSRNPGRLSGAVRPVDRSAQPFHPAAAHPPGSIAATQVRCEGYSAAPNRTCNRSS